MEITEHQVEWAVVVRLRDMLAASPRAEHDVTMAFALFSSIICWIAQRMRTRGNGPNDVAARRFRDRMTTMSFGQFLRGDSPPSQTVAEAIILIRNAVAHADGSSVRPLCRTSDRGAPKLVGYAIEAARGESPAVTIHFSPNMMIKFGTWIADEFIADMTRDAKEMPHPALAEEVSRGVREVRVRA